MAGGTSSSLLPQRDHAVYMHVRLREGLPPQYSTVGRRAVFLHSSAYIHTGRRCLCLFHTCIVVNSPRQCGSGTTSNGATENAAGFSESLRNCSFGGCTWRRPLTRACKYTCVHACTLRVKQPRLEHHVCDLCSPSLLLLPCFW